MRLASQVLMDATFAALPDVDTIDQTTDMLRAANNEAHATKIARQRRKEAEFESMVRAYIDDRYSEFMFGGVTNALSTIAKVLDELHEEIGIADYATASMFVSKCADDCDLQYKRELP